jgi:hypothetical protein
VRKLLGIAVGAFGNARGGQKVVAAALRSALLGVAPFRIRHGNSSRTSWPMRNNAALTLAESLSNTRTW